MEDKKLSQSVSQSQSQFGMWAVALAVMACLAISSIAFIAHERRAVQRMSAQTAAMSAALGETRSQLQEVSTKLAQLSEAQRAAQAPKPAASEHRATRSAVRRDDPRWQQLQDELAEHRKAIHSTQADLAGAKTELSGSVARTHDELLALARKGERNYYEFDLNRSKRFTRQGPISVSLRRANTKHDYADLELRVDDAQLSKKHVNVFEPVMLYTAESKQPVELVINEVATDHIHGYVSMARYVASDLPALSGLTEGPDKTSNSLPGAPQLSTRRQQ